MSKKGMSTIFSIIFLLGVYIFYATFINPEAPLSFGTRITYASPVWSIDGKRIYFVKNVGYWKASLSSIIAGGVGGGGGTYITKTKSYIMSMKPDGSNKRVITKFITKRNNLSENITNEYPAYIENLKLLPKNNEIIFFIRALTGYKGWIYKVRKDGTNLAKLLDIRKVTELPGLFVSPNGTKIAYKKERHGGIGGDEDIVGSVVSSWIMDADGKNNHMICGEESEVEGWTTNGYLIISAYADSAGNIKPMRPSYDYEKKEWIIYDDDIGPKILVYDISSKKLIKAIPRKGYTSIEDLLKAEGFSKLDETISPDSKKRLFVGDETGSIYIEDMDGKNEKILLKGKTH